MALLELNLKREAAVRKEGDRANGERFVWLAERVSQVVTTDSWIDSQLVANVETAGQSTDATEIDRFISRSSRLVFGDSPARGSDSAEVFNGDSVRDLDPAGASDSSSDWEWEALVQGLPAENAEWEALVQGLPRMQL